MLSSLFNPSSGRSLNLDIYVILSCWELVAALILTNIFEVPNMKRTIQILVLGVAATSTAVNSPSFHPIHKNNLTPVNMTAEALVPFPPLCWPTDPDCSIDDSLPIRK
jgi:hypothetical protein